MKRSKGKLRRRYGRAAHKGPPYPYEGYESKASGQRCFVTSVTDGTVFLRLVPQGSNGHSSTWRQRARRIERRVSAVFGRRSTRLRTPSGTRSESGLGTSRPR